MPETLIVSDTGPLISLEKLTDGYSFMSRLYQQILVPPGVVEELCQGEFTNWEEYQAHYELGDFVKVVIFESLIELPGLSILDLGERQAIQLAFQRQLPLLIEEESGRRLAQTLGIKISGIAGQILKAYRTGLLTATSAQDKLTELLQAGRIGKKLHKRLVESL
jgi:predicted nucleic acid-binding protein